MAWIESHTVLLRHRKLLGLSRELRLKPVYTVGHLHALWHNVLEQQEDGDLSSWSDDLIAEAACFNGDSTQFVSLLIKWKWLDGARIVHDWLDYVGLYLCRKYSRRKEKLVAIWLKHGKVYGAEQQQSSSRATTEQQLHAPNPPNHTNQPTNQQAVSRESDEPEAHWVYRNWLFYLRRAANKADDDKVFDELVRLGYPAESLIAEIMDRKRDRTEATWDFVKRIKAAPPKKKPLSEDELREQIRKEREANERRAS